MADFMNSYAGLPAELLSAAANSGIARAVQSCNSDEWDCLIDSASCGTDRACSSDSWCHADEWDCRADGSCGSDGSCSSDGVCRTDVCSSDGTCTDSPSVEKPTASGSITVLGTTDTVIIIRMSAISRAEYYEVAYRKPSDTDAYYEISDSLTYRITDLEPNTTYIINYRGCNSGGDGPFMIPGVTAKTKPSIVPFDWTYSGLNSSGSPVYGSTKRAGYGIYVTADEWNELAESVMDATGNNVSSVYSGQPISASVVNTMARALGVDTVSRGDAISASFFNALRSAYNALT